MATKKNSTKFIEQWYGQLTAVIFFLGIGYSTGSYVSGIGHRMDLIEKNNECEKRISEEKEKYTNCKLEETNKRVTELTSTFETFKTLDGNKKK